jgi:hypothetical protein
VKRILVAIILSLCIVLPARAGPVESLTLEVGPRTVVYGDSVELRGVLSPASAADRVTVLALPYHGGSIPADADPDGDGSWRLSFTPVVTTQFRAVAGGIDSAETPVVSVRPRVHLVVLSARRGLFYTRVEALIGYRGRTAAFQLLGARGWRTLKSVRLGPGAAVRFRADLGRRGASRVRVTVAAGSGYARGVSRTALVRS